MLILQSEKIRAILINRNKMKKNKKIYVIILGIFMGLMSCEKVFNDITQYKDLTPDIVWTDAEYSTQYINGFYADVWKDFTQLDAPATEELGLWQQYTWTDFNTDQMTVSGSGIKASASFSDRYSTIRDLNRFFENVDKGSYSGKAHLKGQAFFFLAYQYYRLVKAFGGVPIVKEVLDPTSYDPDELGRPRNSTLECFDYIVELLDSAIINLPAPNAPGEAIPDYESFRITKPVAMIMKGEVLMWKASPVFCTTPDQNYWQDAYDAMKEAKTWLDDHGYRLYTEWNGSTPPYTGMYYDEQGAKKEWIWSLEYTYPETSPPQDIYKTMRPPSQGGGNESPCPSWNLVQRYLMADGRDTLTSVYDYDQSNFWENRDPRFYQTVAYNGSKYVFPASPDAIPNPNRCQWTFTGVIKGDKPFELTRGGGYGFLNRKGMDTTLNNQELELLETDWPIYRYAEVLLNMAECANELDAHRGEVKDYIIPVRMRAGIENLDGSYGLASVSGHDEWVDVIMNERLIEFAFEGKRVWDIKRRVLFSDFREYEHFYGLQSTINEAGVDALQLKSKRNGATIVLSQLSNVGLSKEDVYVALSDTLETTPDRNALYHQIMTDEVIIGDLGRTVLNPYDMNALEPIPSSVLSTDPMIEQSIDYGGTFNPRLN